MSEKQKNSYANTTTPIGILNYPYLFEPKLNKKSGKMIYSVNLLFPKSEAIEGLDAFKEIIKSLAVKQWPDGVPAKCTFPLKDGDTAVDEMGKPKKELHGYFYMNLTSEERPRVVDENISDVLDKGVVYSGCKGRVNINLFTFSVSGNLGVSARMLSVQKTGDGTPMGSVKPSVEDVFSKVSSNAGSENPANYAKK